MADTTRDPPPLFDDEPSTKEDDGDDLFSSAVQSPVNGQKTPDMTKAAATAEVNLESSAAGDGSSAISSDVLVPQPASSDPLQSVSKEADQGRHVQSPAPNSSSSELQLNEGARPASLSVIDDDSFEGPSSLSSIGVTGISHMQPVPRNMYNISSMGDVEDVTNSMDLFESCVEDAVVRPFAAASITGPQQEVSLDDDDDGLFSGGAFDKTQLKTTAPAAPSAPAVAVLPPMGAPLTPPAASAPLTAAPGTPAVSAVPDVATGASTTSNITTPPLPTAAVGLPATGFYSPAVPAPTVASLNMGSAGATSSKEFIEIMISEPQKVGDGMNSYMAYKMTINTNIPFFKKQSWSVTRRFSDYLGLHAKLVEKHLHAGRIIPPAPEKDALNATKLRLSSSSDGVEGAAEFLERRRAALQRYMQRTAALPHLRSDPDFREFVELEAELPRATQTSAMSGAGVMRLFNRVGETVNKMTFKMEESDTWFEERVHQVESLETELRRLHAALEGLAGGRRELAMSSINLSKAAAVLSSVEEHSALNRALHQLSEATDRTHTVYHAQADADFYILCETTRDYINLIGAVKEVFHERVKVFQAWQYSQTMLAKKRDYKAKLELTARQEKVALAQQEVEEWEGKVERNQEHFERISAAIKKELEQFDAVRVQDFKTMFIRYLESMVTSQQQVIRVWESFLPEAKAIS